MPTENPYATPPPPPGNEPIDPAKLAVLQKSGFGKTRLGQGLMGLLQGTNRAAELDYAGKYIGGQFNQIGAGVDPFTGKPYDPNDPNSTAGRYYSEEKAPIESGFYQQGHNVASYLARQGLGASPGINIGASQQLANNKEALEGQARLKAIDMAQAQESQALLNNLSSQLMGYQPTLQIMAINAQLQAQREQLEAAEMGGLGQGLGMLGGLGAASALGII